MKKSAIYGWMILMFCGCSEKKSSLCSSDCCYKESVINQEQEATNLELSDDLAMASVENEPLVCTLMGSELAERKGKLQKEIFSEVKKTEEIKTGYIFSFIYDENFLVKMTDYVLAENNCCPFFTFEIKLHSKNDALLKITGPPEAKKMLEMFLAEGK